MDITPSVTAPPLDAPASSAVGAATPPLPAELLDPSRTEDFSVGRPAGSSDQALPRIPGFALEQELGRGGMGVVYRARQLPLNRLVALKMILAGDHASQSARVRFLAEAEAIAKVRHPGIVQVHAFGTHQGHPYFALEYVDGGSLDRLLARGPLPPDEAAALVAQLADAVHAAHDAGIIHRDLKPANVLLSFSRESKTSASDSPALDAVSRRNEAIPKITDFGLAKQLDAGPGLTASGAIVGTPSYMAPEQAAGNLPLIGPPTDVYALGAILYECLTGRPPFRGAAVFDTLDMVLRQEPVPVRQLQPKVPRDVETICHKCLQKDAAKRYATAAALADDLRNHLAGKPIHARPVGGLERAWKWCRRYPTVASLFLISLLAAVAALTLAGWAFHEKERAESAEEQVRRESNEKDKALSSAEKRLREVRKGIELIDSLFQSVNPYKPGAASLEDQLRAAIDRAAARLDGEALGDPLTVAYLQTSLGVTLSTINSLQKAEVLLNKSLASRHTLLGPEHDDTLTTQFVLGVVYKRQNRVPEAIALFEKTLRPREAVLGRDHETTLEIMHYLATAYADGGRLDEGIALHEETLRRRQAVLGPRHEHTLYSLHSVAVTYRMAGRRRQALACFEKNLPLFQAVFGPHHPETLTAQQDFATALMEAGRARDALPLFQNAFQHRREKLGVDHPDTLLTMNNMALALFHLGRTRDALALFEQTVQLKQGKLGPEHPETLATMSNLASMYLVEDRIDEALPIYERILPLHRDQLGAEHPTTLLIMNNLAHAYHSLGQSAKALPLARQVLELQQKSLGPEHPDTLTTLGNVAAMTARAGQVERAIPLLEHALALKRKVLGPDHPDSFGAMTSLAWAYRTAGAPARARAVLEAALPAMRKHLGPQHPHTLRCLNDLALVHRDLKDAAKAEALLRESLRLREHHAPDAWQTFHTMTLLGALLLDRREYSAAEPLLLHGCQGMKQRAGKILKKDQDLWPEALARLVQLYEATGNSEAVAKWKQELEAAKTNKQ